MRIEVEWLDDIDGGLTELEAYLPQDPRMDDVLITRGCPVVPPTSLGAAEVLEFVAQALDPVATNVALGVVANVLYDFLRHRSQAGAAIKDTRLRVTRIDHPDGARCVEIEYSGPATTVQQIIRDALGDD